MPVCAVLPEILKTTAFPQRQFPVHGHTDYFPAAVFPGRINLMPQQPDPVSSVPVFFEYLNYMNIVIFRTGLEEIKYVAGVDLLKIRYPPEGKGDGRRDRFSGQVSDEIPVPEPGDVIVHFFTIRITHRIMPNFGNMAGNDDGIPAAYGSMNGKRVQIVGSRCGCCPEA